MALVPDSTRRAFLAGVATAGLSSVGGCFGGRSDGEPTGTGTDAETSTVANAPLPDSPGDSDYAVMGDPDAAPVVTYFGSWKCPFCAEFSVGAGDVLGLGTIVSKYVKPGRLALRYRALAYTGEGDPFLGPDAPRAARAGLAVWTLDPGSYWGYHELVMANQPPESERWATADRLTEFARDAGVEPADRLPDELQKPIYGDLVRDTTRAAGAAGVSGTPSLVVGDRAVSPFEPDRARAALDSLAGG